MKRRTFYLGLGLSSLLGVSCRRVSYPMIRALWISRFDYRTPDDLRQIMLHASEIGFTDVFFQVRAKGTVYYPSRYEPWAYELSGRDPNDTGKNPGWNPLEVAVGQARQYSLRLHAYINVLPGWHGAVDPAQGSGQLWVQHPDWFMVDRAGALMDSTRWYSFLNPAHPEVVHHLARIVKELASFGLDGIHFDYIRYPDDVHSFVPLLYPHATQAELKAHCDFSYDPVSLAGFGKDPSIHPRDWAQFRRDSVTRLVGRLSEVARGVNPRLTLSASIIARPSVRPETFQEGINWGRAGWLDWVVPMIYQTKGFEETLEKNRKRLGRRKSAQRLLVGVHAKHEADVIVFQVQAARTAGCRGVALFSYGELVSGYKKTAKGEALRRCFAGW